MPYPWCSIFSRYNISFLQHDTRIFLYMSYLNNTSFTLFAFSTFQSRCATPCNSNCAGGTCHKNMTCSQGCMINTWGPDCSQTCSTYCTHAPDNNTSSCDRQGRCLFGCEANFTGIFCNETGQCISQGMTLYIYEPVLLLLLLPFLH